MLIVIVALSVARSATAAVPDLSVMNDELLEMNSAVSRIAWGIATAEPATSDGDRLKLVELQAEWRDAWCRRLRQSEGTFDKRQFRQFYILCRGPRYTAEQARELSRVQRELEERYRGTRVCLRNGTCLSGEPDLERLMTTSRDPEQLLEAWTEWRNSVGKPSREPYRQMVNKLNAGARQNGYHDIGECWMEELEADDLEDIVDHLYAEIRPLYAALHAVVRYRLSEYYGAELVSPRGPIPAHLLGNMWAQNWVALTDVLVSKLPPDEDPYAAMRRNRKNYTVADLVKRAEDFYTSIGFDAMTREFWKYSKLEKSDGNASQCHASAANMFRHDDFRMLLCAEITMEDFAVIHHEMGHIEYYNEYQNQPAIFQDGANSAFQESIGDAVMHGVMTPIHLQRLGLVQEVDEASGVDTIVLLLQALSKLPQIPFALALEKWRWGVFRGDIAPENYNRAWWSLTERYQGVKAPVTRGEDDFDPAAKFHVSDNTPYIRYFLSSFLQVQIFEALCKGAVYGADGVNKSVPVPLHSCDIYGSKDGTKALREMMSLGRSVHWSDALRMVTGEDAYSARPLLDYYRPLHEWLLQEIRDRDIPVGW